MLRKTTRVMRAGIPRGMTTVRTADPNVPTTTTSPTRKRTTRTHTTEQAYCRTRKGLSEDCGGTGIRTQETPKGPAAFKAAPFVRSGIPPTECRTLLARAEDAMVLGQVRVERLRDGDRAVLLLVVLEDGDQGPTDGACRAIQRVRRPVAVRVPDPDRQAPGLVVRGVRARRQLTVPVLAGEPGFDVVLLGRRRPQLAGAHVHHPVGDAQIPDQVLLARGVDLGLVGGEEPRDVQGPLPDQDRRNPRDEALGKQPVQAVPDQGEL